MAEIFRAARPEAAFDGESNPECLRGGAAVYDFMKPDCLTLSYIWPRRLDCATPLKNPRAYVEANIIGTLGLLEAAFEVRSAPLLMASTSSVNGANIHVPHAETLKADPQMSFYAATNNANEAMAHFWAHSHDLPITMFRFFSIYSPWSRHDMALFKFTRAIQQGEPIDVYDQGEIWQDLTYMEDLVRAFSRLIEAGPGQGKTVKVDSLHQWLPSWL